MKIRLVGCSEYMIDGPRILQKISRLMLISPKFLDNFTINSRNLMIISC